MSGDGEDGIGDPFIPRNAGVAGDVRPAVDVPEAPQVLVVSRLLPPGGIGDDMAVLAQERFDDPEDTRVGDGRLDEAAPIQHLVAERCRLLRGIPALVGRVLVEDPFDIGTEAGDLVPAEHPVEHRVSVRLEVLYRSGGWVGTKREVSGSPCQHFPILPPTGPADQREDRSTPPGPRLHRQGPGHGAPLREPGWQLLVMCANVNLGGRADNPRGLRGR